MSPVSNSVIEITRYRERSLMNAKTSTLDHSISSNSSTLDTAFNNLINICATLILGIVLALLEVHIRRPILHSHPGVMCNRADAVPGILYIPAQSNEVE